MQTPKLEYRNIRVKEVLDPVTPQMIEAAIRQDLEEHAVKEESSSPAMNHDIVLLDFTGYLDGVAFPGGDGKDYELELGSDTFIPGFEPQLVGMGAGDSKSIFVTFPQDYQEASLAGKRAEFKCTVKKVYRKKLPVLDDTFAMSHGFRNVGEYRMDISSRIDRDMRTNAKFKAVNEVLDRIVKANPFEIPPEILEQATDSYLADFLMQYYQIADVDEFVKATGASKEELRSRIAPAAESRLRGDIVMAAIADEQDFKVSAEEYEAEVANIAERYYTDPETVKKTYPMELITQNMRMSKTLDYLYDTCVEKGSRIILG